MSTLKKNSQFKEIFKRLLKNKLAVIGLIILSALILSAIFAEQIFSYEYALQQDLLNRLKPPSSEHLLGTDSFGRDIFARILHGGRVSLSIGIIAVGAATVIASFLGGIAGYYGGTIDSIIMRIMDMFLSIPPILLALSIVASLGIGMRNLLIALVISSVPGFTRLVRATVLTVKDMEYVEAAEAIGLKKGRIIFRHVLTNCLAPLIVNATMGIGGTILAAASMSFIGLGIKPPRPEWGEMLASGRTTLRSAPHVVIIPGIFIILAVLSINFIGDGLRDALDPKLKD